MAAEEGRARGRQTVRGMVPAMLVVLLAASFIYYFVPHNEDKDPVRPVGYRVELTSARRAAPYPVVAPVGLPKTWRATSVTYEPAGPKGAAWHLGFMTPDDQYAAVEQSDSARTAKYLKGVTQGAHRTDRTVRVGGQEWTRYEGAKYDALVRQDAGGKGDGSRTDGKGAGAAADHRGAHTTVVTGTASLRQLRELAAALRAGDGADAGARQRG